MSFTTRARLLQERLDGARPNNTGIRAIAKEQGKSFELAAHLWKNGGFSRHPREPGWTRPEPTAGLLRMGMT